MTGDSGRQRWVGWERRKKKKTVSSLFNIFCLGHVAPPVGGFNQTVGNRGLGLSVRDGLCIFCTQFMAETTGVFELSHGGEHRRGGCKGEKRLNKRMGLSFISSWWQGEPVSGEGGRVKREEAEWSASHEETVGRNINRWG